MAIITSSFHSGLRQTFEWTCAGFQDSMTKDCPGDQDSPGRSGARFLESWDARYIVKTVGSEEVAEMHRILKDYHQVSVEREICNSSFCSCILH